MKGGEVEREKVREERVAVALIKGNTCYSDLIIRRSVGRQKAARGEEGGAEGEGRREGS